MQSGVGLPGNDATSVMLLVTRFPAVLPWVLWGGRLLNRGIQILLLGALGKNEKQVNCTGFVSLLRSIMSPEDFCFVPVLAAPKPKREKTREQGLSDRVKSLERLRSLEASHRRQIDKLELDPQRHRDMLHNCPLA